jgi:predicted DNA-binding transcriptional regulator YafY
MSNAERVLNRTERLFALVLLLQNRTDLTSKDLAEHFGVSRRTIFRDLRALGESGVPLTYAEGGGYEILEGYQLPPLMLTAREAATLLMGTEFTKLQSDTSLARDADQVGLKIEAVLSPEIKSYIERLRKRMVMDPYWLRSTRAEMRDDEEGRWYELSQAVAGQKSVMMEYYVASRDEVTRRTVDPLGLVYYTDHWNLIAYDHLRGDIRNYRLDAIRSMRILMERFEPPAGFDLERHLAERGESPKNERIRIRFDRRIYRWARIGIPAKIEEETEDEGVTTVVFLFENLDYLAGWLIRYGAMAEVLEPAALIDRLRHRAGELIALYARQEA